MKIIRWLPGCLILFILHACSQVSSRELPAYIEDSARKMILIENAYKKIAEAGKIAQHGFIITRTGNDFSSQMLKSFNRRDKTYSHCGIASIENDSVFVYHALGGEWNPDQKIKREYFQDYADPYNNLGIGIFRFDTKLISPELLVNKAKELYHKEIRFDMDFNLETDDRMYCAEFVSKCISHASGNRVTTNISVIDRFEFIGIDDIILEPGCKNLYSILYK